MQFAIISISFASCSKDDSTTAPTNEIPEIPGYTLTWNDEFDKANIDLTKWEYEVNGDGGGNNELQYYTAFPNNSFIENGYVWFNIDNIEYSRKVLLNLSLFPLLIIECLLDAIPMVFMLIFITLICYLFNYRFPFSSYDSLRKYINKSSRHNEN